MGPKHTEQVAPIEQAASKLKDENAQRQARRAMLRLGIGASPALLMLPSAPVGASQLCVLASSYVSPSTFNSMGAAMGHTMQCTINSGHVQTYMNEAASHISAKTNSGTPLPSPFSELVRERMGALGGDPPGCTGYTTSMTVADALFNQGNIDSTSVQSLLQHLLALSVAITRGDYRPVAPPFGGSFDTAYIASVWQNCASNGYSTFTGGGLVWPRSNVIAWARTAMGLTGYFV